MSRIDAVLFRTRMEDVAIFRDSFLVMRLVGCSVCAKALAFKIDYSVATIVSEFPASAASKFYS